MLCLLVFLINQLGYNKTYTLIQNRQANVPHGRFISLTCIWFPQEEAGYSTSWKWESTVEVPRHEAPQQQETPRPQRHVRTVFKCTSCLTSSPGADRWQNLNSSENQAKVTFYFPLKTYCIIDKNVQWLTTSTFLFWFSKEPCYLHGFCVLPCISTRVTHNMQGEEYI